MDAQPKAKIKLTFMDKPSESAPDQMGDDMGEESYEKQSIRTAIESIRAGDTDTALKVLEDCLSSHEEDTQSAEY